MLGIEVDDDLLCVDLRGGSHRDGVPTVSGDRDHGLDGVVLGSISPARHREVSD